MPFRRETRIGQCKMMKSDESLQRPTALEPITDSPWFWAALFTGVALAALLATGGKFGKRQANIENKYQARTAVVTGELQVESDGRGVKTTGAVPHYSTPDDPVIPIWPVEVILGVLLAGSLGLLLRQRFGSDARAPEAPRSG